MPYFSVSSSNERARHLQLALRGSPPSPVGSSSMQPHDQRRAEAAGQRHHLLEALLAVLEVDRVDDRLALAVGERRSITCSSVESIISGTRTFLITMLEEGVDVGELVAVRVGQADVDDLAPRASPAARAISLASSNFPATISSLNFLRADHVGALADDHRAVVLVRPPGSRRRRAIERSCVTGTRGRLASAIAAIARMCAGVVPQQPPTTFSQPCSQKRRAPAPASRGVSR